MTRPHITWTGDLDDDCTAYWCGLVLRAEAMDEDSNGNGTDWWWDVSDESTVGNDWTTYAGSNGDGILDDGEPAGKVSGVEARVAAETVARIVVHLKERGLIKEGRLG